MKKIKINSFKKIIFFWIFVSLLDYGLLSSNALTDLYLNKIANIPGSSVGYDVDIDGNYAYITDNKGYIVVDIENPVKPKKIGEFKLTEAAFGIFVKDKIAYVAAGGYGLYITDINNPANPILFGHESSEGICNDVYASGDYAYVSNYDYGLQIFNIEDLANPVKITDYSYYGRADSIAVEEDYAYLASPGSGVVLLNISTPSSPQSIKTLHNTNGAKDLRIYQNLLFVGCYSSNVLVFDISNPSDPIQLGIHSDNDGGEAHGVVGNSTHLYVADNFGVEYLDITNLPIISKVAEYRRRISSAHDIDFSGNYLIVAGGNIRGSTVFEVSQTQKTNYIGIYIGVPITVFVLSFTFLILYRKRVKK